MSSTSILQALFGHNIITTVRAACLHNTKTKAKAVVLRLDEYDIV